MTMGLVSSTVATIRIFFCDMELITVYRKNSLNPFFWCVVIQNSPGTISYDPTMPSIYRWDSVQKVIIAACKTYVDNL